MSARVPRLLVIGFVAVLATAGLTYGAEQKLSSPSTPAPSTPLVQQRAVLTVPDVRNQAFVFAKGALQDAGFAWRVIGSVRGYPANRVLSQTPAPGSRVYDTGAPLVTVALARNARYPQEGTPEDTSPYHATATEVAEAAVQPIAPAPSTTTPAGTTPTSTTPGATTPAATTPTTTDPSYPSAPSSSSADHTVSPSHATHAAAPATAPAHTPAAAPAPAASPAQAPAAAKPAAPRYPQNRPPAFAVAGAPKEPLDEMPLDMRARALDRWLTAHPHPSNALVEHWLYQNEWIVTGARFGWWHGAQALAILIRVDVRAQALWGVGAKSEAVARGALAEVQARSR